MNTTPETPGPPGTPGPPNTPTPPPPEDSGWNTLVQALIFFGLLLSVGSAGAILRTRQPSLFFSILMILGIVIAGVGFWLRSKNSKPPAPPNSRT